MPPDPPATAPADGAVMPCPRNEPEHWLEIELVDEDGQPVPNEEYKVVLPDGQVLRGFLDQRGCERIAPIAQAGTCQVSFPNFDRRDWRSAD